MRGAVTENQRQKRDRLVAELLAPDWDLVERESGCRASAALRVLYSTPALVTQLDLLVQDPAHVPPAGEWSVDCFQRADADALRLHGTPENPAASFCFALAYRGDLYGVVLSESGEDGPVYRYSFDGEETWVAPSLAAFLSWPRRRRPSGYEPPAG